MAVVEREETCWEIREQKKPGPALKLYDHNKSISDLREVLARFLGFALIGSAYNPSQSTRAKHGRSDKSR